jgi:hypothetical protein
MAAILILIFIYLFIGVVLVEVSLSDEDVDPNYAHIVSTEPYVYFEHVITWLPDLIEYLIENNNNER